MWKRFINIILIGTLNAANGDKYEGDWDDDMKNGNGKLIITFIGIYNYNNGDIYEGSWLDDTKDGKGKKYIQYRNFIWE